MCQLGRPARPGRRPALHLRHARRIRCCAASCPWWLAASLVGQGRGRRPVPAGAAPAPVTRRPRCTYVGKGATFALLDAFPLMLFAQGGSESAALARPIGYAFIIWGIDALRLDRRCSTSHKCVIAVGGVPAVPGEARWRKLSPRLAGGRERSVRRGPEELTLHPRNTSGWRGRGEGTRVRIGITDFAQSQLGDVVFVAAPEVGEQVTAGQARRRGRVDQERLGHQRAGRR